jgi:O-antigen/teichoic acid export membrane protein
VGEEPEAVTERDAGEAVTAPPTADVRRTMFWLTLGTLVYLGGQWLLTVIVVRISGQATNGQFTLALSSSSVAYAVALFGMRPYQISDTRGEYRDATYLASRLVTSVLAVLAFAVSLPFTADAARLWPVLALFMGFRLTEGWMDVLHGILQNADRMRLAGIALIARAVLECVGFAATLAATQSLLAAVAVMLAISFLALVVLEWPWSRSRTDGIPFREAGGWTRTFRLVRNVSPLLVANLAYSVMLFVPRNAIGAVWGSELLGYYGSIAAPLLLIPVLVSYLYTPFMPLLAEHALSHRRSDLLRLTGRILLAILALIIVALVALPFVGPPVLSLMFGRGILDHLDLLWPVAASVSCTALAYLGNAVLTACRRIRWTLYAAVVALVLVLTLSGYLVRVFGPNGASFALVIGQGAQVAVLAIGFLTGLRAIRRPAGVRPARPS